MALIDQAVYKIKIEIKKGCIKCNPPEKSISRSGEALILSPLQECRGDAMNYSPASL
jgi:hypothetical protein